MKSIDTLVIAVGGKGERISNDFLKLGYKGSKSLYIIKTKPLVGHLIDLALKTGFRRVYLLVSYFEKDFREYLLRYYPKNKKIIPIYGKRKGRTFGVPYVLHLMQNELTEPFVYSDGNILFSPRLLRRMKSFTQLTPAHVSIAVSKKDNAPTHSHIQLHNNRIAKIIVRLPVTQSKKLHSIKTKTYCSMGLMTFSHTIFTAIPHFEYKRDLDIIINELFQRNANLVKVLIYRGAWRAIHTRDDLDTKG